MQSIIINKAINKVQEGKNKLSTDRKFLIWSLKSGREDFDASVCNILVFAPYKFHDIFVLVLLYIRKILIRVR